MSALERPVRVVIVQPEPFRCVDRRKRGGVRPIDVLAALNDNQREAMFAALACKACDGSPDSCDHCEGTGVEPRTVASTATHGRAGSE